MEAFHFIYLGTGLVIGGLAAWFIAKLTYQKAGTSEDLLKAKELEIELRAERDRSEELSKNLGDLNQDMRGEREKLMELNSQKAMLEQNNKNLLENLKTQKEELTQIQQKFSAEFKNLANEIFEEKSKKFTEHNKQNIDELLRPLGKKIGEFEQKVVQTNNDSIKWNAALKQQIDDLKGANIKITKEAENLVKALKGDSKAQGNWGERQLEGILEKVGLKRDIHYSREQNFKAEDGSNQRLDFIVSLPDNKSLVIDSKVSLTAYARYFEEEEDAKREAHLKEHLISINKHIGDLGNKDYQNLYGINQPDYIMLFVANEPALTIALQEDQGLYEKALEKNIVLVSTSTLLATLRTVSYIWKQDAQSKHAIEIARQGGALYDKFVGFTNDLIKVGKNLETTSGAYKDAMGKLVDGRDNLVKKTEKLKELGIKASKSQDQKLIDRSEG